MPWVGWIVAVALVFALPNQVSYAQSDDYGWLGADLVDVAKEQTTPLRQDRPTGAKVKTVWPGSPADRAGLRGGDLILFVDGMPIDASAHVQGAVVTRRPGQEMRLDVLRGEQERKMLVILTRPPPKMVISGERARWWTWPFIATLRYQDTDGKTSGHVCGGTIVAPNWVLTAAHCVVDHAESGTLVGSYADHRGKGRTGTLEVVIGRDDLQERIEPQSVFEVAEVRVHPAFCRRTAKLAPQGPCPTAQQPKRRFPQGMTLRWSV